MFVAREGHRRLPTGPVPPPVRHPDLPLQVLRRALRPVTVTMLSVAAALPVPAVPVAVVPRVAGAVVVEAEDADEHRS